jgi:Spy/CpxP family protein refolding chaperone
VGIGLTGHPPIPLPASPLKGEGRSAFLFNTCGAVLAFFALNLPAFAQPTPYAGEQSRAIKALSEREIADLRAGKGMGYAKPAELASYPGPMHVLEHARELALTPAQREATQALIPPMREAAISAAERYITAERELDTLFVGGTASEAQLNAALQKSALALAEVRASHLRTHIAQRALLTPAQIAQYNTLRGYTQLRAPGTTKDY